MTRRSVTVVAAAAGMIGAAMLALASPGNADSTPVAAAGVLDITTTTLATCPSLDAVASTSTTLVPLTSCETTTTTTAPAPSGSTDQSTTTTTTPVATATTTTTTTAPASSTGQPATTATTVPGATTSTTPGPPSGDPAALGSTGTDLPSGSLATDGLDPAGLAQPAAATPGARAGSFEPSSLSLDGAVLLGGFNASTDEPAPLVAAPAGQRSTDAVLAALASLSLSEEMRAHLFAPFPLAGPASYADDGTAGVDIATAPGTPVVASAPGTVTVAGRTLTLRTTDGTTYTYGGVTGAPAHQGAVTAGTIIGHVPDDGIPAVHFEVRPRGGAAIDPVPLLDRWLAQALQTAKAMTSHSSMAGSGVARPAGQAAVAALAGAARQLTDPVGAPSSPIPAVVVLGAAAAWVVRRRRRALHAVLGTYNRDGGGRGATRTFDRQ